MIYIIHAISVLLKITQITLKITFSNVVSRSIREFHLKKKKKKIFTTYNGEKFKA